MSLYFECHITIEPVFEVERESVAALLKPFKFKVAELLLQKRTEDTAERSKYDTFATSRSTDAADIMDRMVSAIRILQINNFKVWRYKIEDCLFDSKVEDTGGLLVPPTAWVG